METQSRKSGVHLLRTLAFHARLQRHNRVSCAHPRTLAFGSTIDLGEIRSGGGQHLPAAPDVDSESNEVGKGHQYDAKKHEEECVRNKVWTYHEPYARE